MFSQGWPGIMQELLFGVYRFPLPCTAFEYLFYILIPGNPEAKAEAVAGDL
jgi:hypothetical protein